MAALKEVVSLYQTLKHEWTKKPCNLQQCGQLLNNLKVKLLIEKIYIQFNLFIDRLDVTY